MRCSVVCQLQGGRRGSQGTWGLAPEVRANRAVRSSASASSLTWPGCTPPHPLPPTPKPCETSAALLGLLQPMPMTLEDVPNRAAASEGGACGSRTPLPCRSSQTSCPLPAASRPQMLCPFPTENSDPGCHPCLPCLPRMPVLTLHRRPPLRSPTHFRVPEEQSDPCSHSLKP